MSALGRIVSNHEVDVPDPVRLSHDQHAIGAIRHRILLLKSG